jgi:ryanodine receptor 2
LNSTPSLLPDYFLPVSHKIAEKASILYQREVFLKMSTRNVDSADRESIETDLQKDYEILIRNLYAFYPLLIKYVDMHRTYWLKYPDEHSERLYYHIAEVFNLWLKSKMFKREEINFVSSNDIDNMLLIMPNSISSNLANVSGSTVDTTTTSSEAQRQNKPTGKKRKAKLISKDKKFTSLVVACLKRLVQIGINFFGGKEQELIQIAKQKLIDIKIGNEIVLSNSTNLVKAKNVLTTSQSPGSAGTNEDNSQLELTKEQEEIVESFIRRYLKSSEISTLSENGYENFSEDQSIDKETYKKTQWQRVLYRKIASKRHLFTSMSSLSQEAIIEKIMEIAKVLYGLHMVEHPQVKTKGTWRKLISGQRKKAVMACFRMAPLHSIPHHRAINLFLKSYKQNWVDNEFENDTDIACLIPDLCPQNYKSKELSLASKVENENAEIISTVNSEESKDKESKAVADSYERSIQPDPLSQLLSSFNRAATTEQASIASPSGSSGSFNLTNDTLYMAYAEIMSKSCEIEEDSDDEDEPAEVRGNSEEDQSNAKEEEMQKQKLIFEQLRLADRGAAEMALLYISASKGEKSEMLEKTLQLGISLLHGGNTQVQQRMLNHLKEKKDVGFFTSLAGLMSNCSVLDLDTFERCIKAEQFGGISSSDSGSGMAGKKNLHDADFTCSLFRFLQLLCEGHNLEFQNYLRSQTGNNTTVNTIICTVDYLLRLQESIMDFYWHYCGKSSVDAAGKDNFCRAITVAKQVFNTLTEYIQGPCLGNQLTLAHSRLWDAIGGFLYIFANLQDKLSKDPHQIELLRELMKLQKDMIIMLLSMLEGNVLNGPIGKQMVDTLIENQQNVEMLLKFFDIFLKMKDLTTSEAFKEFDTNADGWISPKEFRKAMEAQKMYTNEEIDYILMCVDTNQDGKIDFMEFTERFHNPAKDIGFNMAVLLTNLSEHMSHDTRLDRLMKKASSFLNYFEPFLGRIEITGSSGRIERVYFEIKESNIEQWNKPQIKESKRQFLYDIVNEGDEKEKLEQFVNFCEDTIFEMQHAASISLSSDDDTYNNAANEDTGQVNASKTKRIIDASKHSILFIINLFSPSKLHKQYTYLRKMTVSQIMKASFDFFVYIAFILLKFISNSFMFIMRWLYIMIAGQNIKENQIQNIKPNETFNLKYNEQLGYKKKPKTYDEFNIDEDFAQHNSLSIKPFGLSGLESENNKLKNEDNDENLNEQEEDLIEKSVNYDKSSNENHNQTNEINAKKQLRALYNEEIDEDLSNQISLNQNASNASSSNYKKILSMFARNFYKLKYLALILAFLINFLMLFYKARNLNEDPDSNELIEIIMMDPDEYYIEHLLKALAFVHSLVAFGMMVAYYVLKVPLVIFKREKEIARKLEFEGLWIAEQPSEDDLRSHWDKLVLSTRTYPGMYWDKFVKKKVKIKYTEQFDVNQLCKLLGIDSKNDEYRFEESNVNNRNKDKNKLVKDKQPSNGIIEK